MLRYLNIISVFLCTLALFTIQAHAEIFRNEYISFEMPPNWSCSDEGTEWICVSRFDRQSKEAIIVLTAKEVGPTDNFEYYTNYLKTPRSLPDTTGMMKPSEVLNVQERMINNHKWIDALHLGSEITSYYTRYVATVKDQLAILITLSAHREHYTKYSNDFLKTINSLSIVAPRDLFTGRPAHQGSGEVIGAQPIAPMHGSGVALPDEPSSGLNWNTIIGIILLIGAIGVYFWIRKKPQ